MVDGVEWDLDFLGHGCLEGVAGTGGNQAWLKLLGLLKLIFEKLFRGFGGSFLCRCKIMLMILVVLWMLFDYRVWCACNHIFRQLRELNECCICTIVDRWSGRGKLGKVHHCIRLLLLLLFSGRQLGKVNHQALLHLILFAFFRIIGVWWIGDGCWSFLRFGVGALEWQLWLLWFALGLWGALYMVEQRVEVAVLLTLEVEAESGTQSVQFGDLVSVIGERAPLLIKV